MKKILLIFSVFLCFLPFFSTNFASADNNNTKYVVTANSATIFEMADFSSTKLKIVNHKDILTVETNAESPVEYGDNIKFFKVMHENTTGFVVADLLTPQKSVITSIPNFNGQTNKTCDIFIKNDTDFSKNGHTLNKGERIFLYEGFSNKNDYIAIAYLKDNEVMYGYLSKEDISPDGINPIIITCISLIIAVVGIVFAWVFIKNKKVKLKK